MRKTNKKLISVLLINSCNFTLLFSDGNLTNQPMISIEKGKLSGVGRLFCTNYYDRNHYANNP